MPELNESVPIPEDVKKVLPKENLVQIVAKTTSPTVHKEDPQYPLRLFPKEELQLAARTLAEKPVGVNHKTVIDNAWVVNADWNPETSEVEALLYLPTEYIEKIRSKKIGKVSVEYNWDEAVKEGEGTVFKGLKFSRVDLLDGATPGDKGTSITLMESDGKSGRIDIPLEEKTLKEPCSPELQACVDALIADGKPEDSAWAICKDKLGEKKPDPTPPAPLTKTPPVEEATLVGYTLAGRQILEQETKALKEAVVRLQGEIKKLKESRAQSKKEAVEEICKAVGAVLPESFIVKQSGGARRVAENVKRVLRELTES